jgi:two-component system sporulation sensor kinase A
MARNQVSDDKGKDQKYAAIFKSAAVGIAVIDPDGSLTEANPTFLEDMNFTKDQILHQDYADVFLGQRFTELKETLVSILAGKSSQVNLEVVFRSFPDDEAAFKILRISVTPIKSLVGDEQMIMLITEDVTEQKETHQALIESEKLALTGRLAASLAHEINNPMQTAMGCLGLAEEMLTEKEGDLHLYLTMALDELKRGARIVKRLKDLNRPVEKAEKAPVNLKTLLSDILVLTQNQLQDRDIQAAFEPPESAAMILGSKDLMHQVFLNLVMNAIDAMPGGGEILITLTPTTSPDGFEVKVQDTGSGIEAADLVHVFDPFFTTKEDGIGLGLYICKRIIQEHKGRITLKSVVDDGTEFTVWLPALAI